MRTFLMLLCLAFVGVAEAKVANPLPSDHRVDVAYAAPDAMPALALSQVAPEAPSLEPAPAWAVPAWLLSGITLVLGALGGFAFFSGKRKRIVALAILRGYQIVEDIGNELEGEDGFDKAARAMKEIDNWMLANGWRPLKPGEKAAAELELKALHGAGIAAAKVIAKAAELSPPKP